MNDACPRCGSILQVVNSKVVGDTRVRYIGCRRCGFRPENNKTLVPAIYAPYRRRAPVALNGLSLTHKTDTLES
jgi:hypothetical protein